MLDFAINCWLLVADTDEYAGNFERDLTAYLTGEVGECGVGTKMAELFAKETAKDKNRPDFDFMLLHMPDDRGCRRPCTIYTTPGWFSNGHGGHFRVGEEEIARVAAVTAETARLEGRIKQVEGLKGNSHAISAGWTPTAIKKELSDLNRKLKQVHKARDEFSDACMSVAVIFEKKPSAETVAWIKNRARGFNEARRKMVPEWDRDPINITGWRLVEVKTVVTEEKA